MTEPQHEWWSPEVLAAREREIRSGTGAEATDVRNDFASYKASVSGSDARVSGLYMHNEVEPWRIDTVCRGYATLVRRTRNHDPKTIADFGCGAGFTTDGLRRTWPSATVTGFEVSVDAVQVVAPRMSRRLPFVVSRAAARLLRDLRPGWVRNLYVLQR